MHTPFKGRKALGEAAIKTLEPEKAMLDNIQLVEQCLVKYPYHFLSTMAVSKIFPIQNISYPKCIFQLISCQLNLPSESPLN